MKGSIKINWREKNQINPKAEIQSRALRVQLGGQKCSVYKLEMIRGQLSNLALERESL
jgi:hypothetical protein